MWAWMMATALAAPLTVSSNLPVSVRVDGEWLARVTTEATGEVASGSHHVEVCDVGGGVLASLDVEVAAEPVKLVYEDRRLQRFVEPVVVATKDGRIPMSTNDLRKLEQKLLKSGRGSRLKKLAAGIDGEWLYVVNADALLAPFDILEDRVLAAKIIGQRILDLQNSARIESHFVTELARQEVHDYYESLK